RFGQILIILGLTTNIYGQSNCVCVDYENQKVKPDTVFHFGEKSLAICNGYFENGFVSEFSLKSCEDNSIDIFYDATLQYKFEVKDDTLFLSDYRFLWNFNTQKFDKSIWAKEKFWIEHNDFKHDRVVVYQLS